MKQISETGLPPQAQQVKTSETCARKAIVAHGQVQGVGFRPFVWRLAKAERLSGFVANTSAGVRIEVQGKTTALQSFMQKLQAELPPLAKISSLDISELPLQKQSPNFAIRASEGHAGQNVLVSPDVSICPDCLADIRDPQNPRFAYPFTNCTNCGPRFSITRSIPYDRASTTMACFALCATCAREYANPADRRFHAQPIACPTCGPLIWYVDQAALTIGQSGPCPTTCEKALTKAAKAILTGQILALRGLGGFQLVCDATNASAVRRLRKRKNRPHKALAVMARSLKAAEVFCEIDSPTQNLLESPQKPIVLCPMKNSASLEGIAPDALNLGLMLPYTPLHALLLDELAAQMPTEPLLVMTSANPKGEPICLGNREALERLSELADAWLLHNRDILCRVDDSVVLPASPGPVFIRRARGYVPAPVALGGPGPVILGTGAELKATFCLTRADNAFLGQHIGDLRTPANMAFYEQALEHLQNLLEVTPETIVHDLHPDFLSSQFAQRLAAQLQIPAHGLQHHAAHASACLAENGKYGPSLALCLDGSGAGTDGTIWGGEILLLNLGLAQWQRLGCFSPLPLPGGEIAIREPWRIATALAWQTGQLPKVTSKKELAVGEILKKNLNCPQTSSCGRLFDAMASLLDLCHVISYEGQAAMLLEKAALAWLKNNSESRLPDFGAIPILAGELARIDTQAIFCRASQLCAQNLDSGGIAATFHYVLAGQLTSLAALLAERHGLKDVALTGGVMQNSLLARLLSENLRKAGLCPLPHKQVPPGDGGIALGQAVWGRQLAINGKL